MNCPACGLIMDWCCDIPLCMECVWVRKSRKLLKATMLRQGEPIVNKYIVTVHHVERVVVEVMANDREEAKRGWRNGNVMQIDELEAEPMDAQLAA